MLHCPKCQADMPEGTKACLFCQTPLVQTSKAPWYFRTESLVVGFLVAGPLILPMVWFNPRYSWTKKIVVTVVVLGLTLVITKFLVQSMKTILEYYQPILNPGTSFNMQM